MSKGSYLGLKLRKCRSLLTFIRKKLSGNISDLVKTMQVHDDDATLFFPKKKASNFPATLLKIGNWKREAKYESEIVAKIYFAKKKLVWEILKCSLKYKIEILWSDIMAIEATDNNNGHDILKIELSKPPLFFGETNPQPKKHTLWQSSNDFTDGEASIHRRHYLEFPEGTLGKHYKNLMQCDKRLKQLSQGGYPSLPSQFFARENEGPHFYHDYRSKFLSLYSQQSRNWCTSQLQGSSQTKAIVPISSDMDLTAIEQQHYNHLVDPAYQYLDEVSRPFIDGNNLDESYIGFLDQGFENTSLNPTVQLQKQYQEVIPLNVCSTYAPDFYPSQPIVGEFTAGTESDGCQNNTELQDNDRGLQILEDCMMVEPDVSLRDNEPSLLARVQSMENILDEPGYLMSQEGEAIFEGALIDDWIAVEDKDISNQVEVSREGAIFEGALIEDWLTVDDKDISNQVETSQWLAMKDNDIGVAKRSNI